MKRTITLRFLLSLCVLTLCSFLGGKELTITAATTVELNTNEYGSSQNWIAGSSTTLSGKTITFNDVISMTYDKGSASDPYYRTWGGTNCFYSRKGSSFTISAIEGYYITEISFTTNRELNYTAESGSLSSDKTKWTAEEGEKTNAIKFNCTNNTYITSISVTYESQVSDSKGDSQLTIESEVSIDYKESYTVKATASDKDGNPISGNITYTIISSASSDYTFDEGTGVFTAGTTPGSYTVEAYYEANDDYNASLAQCVITVMEPGVSSWKDYRLVTEQSQVVEGAQYILVCPIVEYEYNSLYTMGSIDPYGYAYSYNAGGYALSNNGGISSTVESSVMPFILEKVNGNFALKTLDGQYLKGFIGWYGMTYDIELGSSNSASEAQWSIEIDQDGNAHIYNVYDNSQALMYRADVQQFKNYSHSSYGGKDYPAVKLYAKCAEMSIKQEALGYGTYAVDFAYQMPKGVKGYAINAVNDGVEDETKKLVKNEAYAEETDVPILTPLLVYSEEAAAASKTYYPIVIYKDVEAYEGDNYLEYKRNGGMTASKKGEPVYYYKLTKKSSDDPAEHKPLGFYWGAEDGAAFMLNNSSSAYLALPQSLFANGSLASALLFDEEGQVTDIQLTTTTENNTQTVYNLQGVRVSGKLAKGIYIVNGKKVLVK